MPDITTTQIFSDGEKGITATKLNNIIANSIIQPSFVTAKPASSTLDPTDQLLEVKGAGTYATITGQQLINSVSASVTQNIQPTIWSVRLRSFNSLGNNTFEVDQRNGGGGIVGVANAAWVQDRWQCAKTGTMTINSSGYQTGAIQVPGTSFNIANGYRYYALTTQQTSLGAGDYLTFRQTLEGCNWRELAGDVTSISLLVNSSVANHKFSVALRSPDGTKSLVKLCTVPSASTWTLIPLPNIPMPSGGNFSINPGVAGYTFDITLACGATLIASAADTWQNGNFLGAPGMDNWASNPVNALFGVVCVQHEPGSQCSTLMDKSFFNNYTECQRYFTKSYPYATKPGTASVQAGMYMMPVMQQNLSTLGGSVYFPVRMANAPTLAFWSYDGTANSVSPPFSATKFGVTGAQCIGDSGFSGVTLSATAGPAGQTWQGHYTADTGF